MNRYAAWAAQQKKIAESGSASGSQANNRLN
jgi:hypothetical protein